MQFYVTTHTVRKPNKSKGLYLFLITILCIPSLSFAEEGRSKQWTDAFTTIDKGNYKQAASQLETLKNSNITKEEKLEIHHTLGNLYEKLNNRPKAVGNYVRVITPRYPHADSAAFRLAKLYERMNNKDKAISWYSELIEGYPDSYYLSEAKWNLTKLYLDKKRYGDAKSTVEDILIESEYERRATYALARCEEGLKQYSTAFKLHQKLLSDNQSDSIADDAMGKLKMLANDHTSLKRTVVDRLHCGLVLYYKGSWKSAINELMAVSTDSDIKLKSRALYYIGRSNEGRKWYNTALKQYNLVVGLGDKSEYLTRAHYRIAQCYHAKGSLTTAIKQLESFVKTYSWSELADNALYDIAQIYEKREKTESALNAYSRLIDIDPGGEYADLAAWRIGWRRFDQKKYEESYTAFKGLKENFPNNRYAMGAHFWMAKIREKQNQPEAAHKIYTEVAKARYWYYSARAKALLGITSSELVPKAVPDAKLSVQDVCPDQVLSLMGLRLYEDAIYLLKRHISIVSNPDPFCYYALIMSYESLAMYDKAREVADMVLDSPSFDQHSSSELVKLRRWLYPLHYENFVNKYSKQYNVDKALIFAMILEESRYRRDAISWAGAIGLMQIMPSTGRELARQLKIRRFRSSMLKDPEINIRMGTKYIGYLNSIFDNDPMLVSGAYNGGPGRMKRWLDSKQIKDIDEFVEKITIRETRLHIKKVINSYDNYIEIYGQSETPAVNSAFEKSNQSGKDTILVNLQE
ncbi:transglycosylase SLT domain-containing protein [Candidatus Poribacteria bacterium]|nr:transglycosylase SLT domain-containing protein [Candidatus Poribacteria bacterium]